jgi:EAL domain-containing protein (putative c-di-GMP-specific phosphodiesterase class I)
MATAQKPLTSHVRHVLVIDDEPAVLRVISLLLERHGFRVDSAVNGREGLKLIETNSYNVILSDIIMPELSGVDFLRELRRHDLDVPVILMTAGPTLDSALDAIEYGAQQYLLKPVEPGALVLAVGRGAALGDLARLKRTALANTKAEALPYGDRATLEIVLKRAFDSIHIVYAPIVSLKKKSVFGYEALMRCDESLFASYQPLSAAAGRIGWQSQLSRAIYQAISRSCTELPEGATLFVNIHTADAHDGQLVGSRSPLEPIARNVVLEVSEHAPASEIDSLASQLRALRGAGFRLALDDLGTGPQGLMAFSRLNPDFTKLDRSILAGLDHDPARQKIVRAMYALCAELGVPVIAEGVETPGERDALIEIGADLAQGHLWGKPSRDFATPAI